RCRDDKSRRLSALDTVGSRVPRNAGLTASARASRLRRAAPPAAWRSSRSCGTEPRGAETQPLSASAEVNAENKEYSEQKIANERIAKKHPARRRAVLRQSHRERLDESSQILRVTRIAQPGKRVRDSVKKCRSSNGSRQKRLQRCAILQKKPDAADRSEREITHENLRVEQRRTVTKIYHRDRNKKRNERH